MSFHWLTVRTVNLAVFVREVKLLIVNVKAVHYSESLLMTLDASKASDSHGRLLFFLC